MVDYTETRTCAGCDHEVTGYRAWCDDCRKISHERHEAFEARVDEIMDECGERLTPSQRRSIRAIAFSGWKAAAGNELQYADEHEIKRFEITRTDYGVVMVIASFGRVGDEKTLMRLYRYTGQFFLGSHGGITWYNGEGKGRKGRGRLYRAWRDR